MDLEALLNRPQKRPAAASSMHRPAAAQLPAKKRPAQVIDLDPPDYDLEFLLDKEIGIDSLQLAFKSVLVESTTVVQLQTIFHSVPQSQRKMLGRPPFPMPKTFADLGPAPQPDTPK